MRRGRVGLVGLGLEAYWAQFTGLEARLAIRTSRDFTRIDPMTLDFLNSTEGHPRTLSFSTQPAWLRVQKAQPKVPADVDGMTCREECSWKAAASIVRGGSGECKIVPLSGLPMRPLRLRGRLRASA